MVWSFSNVILVLCWKQVITGEKLFWRSSSCAVFHMRQLYSVKCSNCSYCYFYLILFLLFVSDAEALNKCLCHPCHFSVWLSSRVVFLWGVITASRRHLLVPGHLGKWWEAICCLRRKRKSLLCLRFGDVRFRWEKLEKGQKGRTKTPKLWSTVDSNSELVAQPMCQEVGCERSLRPWNEWQKKKQWKKTKRPDHFWQVPYNVCDRVHHIVLCHKVTHPRFTPLQSDGPEEHQQHSRRSKYICHYPLLRRERNWVLNLFVCWRAHSRCQSDDA